VEPETLGGGQVPPELVALAHDEGEPPAKRVLPHPGDVPEDAGGAAGGRDDAREQLEKRGLARTVGAEQRHEFAASDPQVHPAERLDDPAGAVEQAADARREALGLVMDAVFLGESLDLDHRGGLGFRTARGVVHAREYR
jgi:hypothetical protein